MVACQGCGVEVTKPGHYKCHACWYKKEPQTQKQPQLSPSFQKGPAPTSRVEEREEKARRGNGSPAYKFQSSAGGVITATKLADHFAATLGAKITAQKVNRVLESLGWITRSPYESGGWVSTKAGRNNGASDHVASSGVPFVKYDETVLKQRSLQGALSELAVPTQLAKAPEPTELMETDGCHCSCGKCSILGKTQKYKTRDGHYVRSRGEAMIDNFLYFTRVPHAYELEVHLPGDKVLTPDFCCLTAKGNVYIEFWGMEGQPDYDKSMEYKKKLYEEFDLELIDVWPDNLDDLDAYLSRKLAQHGVRTA